MRLIEELQQFVKNGCFAENRLWDIYKITNQKTMLVTKIGVVEIIIECYCYANSDKFVLFIGKQMIRDDYSSLDEIFKKAMSLLKAIFLQLATELGYAAMLEENFLLELARAQFAGYKYGEGTKVIEVIKSMGLTFEEWEKIKLSGDTLLSDSDIITVDDYFKEEKPNEPEHNPA